MSLAPFSSPRAAPEPLTFREARDRLLELGQDYHGARAAFSWPRPHEFNWALEWFDAELAAGEHGGKTALKVIGERVETRTFAELARESSSLANGLRALGAKRGDRLLMMLGVVPELWATMLASMKLGLVLIPAMPTLGHADIADRLERGQAKYLVAHGADAEKFAGLAESVERIAIGETPSGWRSYDALLGGELFHPDGPTKADDPMLLYFTSGTTARSKLVVHTHASYPIGHLSTMYGLGSSPATRISTFPRPAGPSTPGRASSRPGTPARRSLRFACASSRARRSTRWSSTKSRCSARRRPSGGC